MRGCISPPPSSLAIGTDSMHITLRHVHPQCHRCQALGTERSPSEVPFQCWACEASNHCLVSESWRLLPTTLWQLGQEVSGTGQGPGLTSRRCPTHPLSWWPRGAVPASTPRALKPAQPVSKLSLVPALKEASYTWSQSGKAMVFCWKMMSCWKQSSVAHASAD